MGGIIPLATLLLCCLGGIVNCYRSGIPQAWKPSRNRDICLKDTLWENHDDITCDTMHIPFGGGRMEFKWHDSIGKISASDWDSCLESENKPGSSSSSPFLEHSWLHSLEESGCASQETGWRPCHLTIRIIQDNNINGENDMTIDGCVPVYLKSHSMGEFVFDNAWADVACRSQIDYYPKLLVGVPFTPVTGSRFLWHPRVRKSYPLEHLDRAVGTFLMQSVIARNLSSVHINFCTDEEASILSMWSDGEGGDMDRVFESDICLKPDGHTKEGSHDDEDTERFRRRHLIRSDTDIYLRRTSLQYHWQNRNALRNGLPFTDFEDYLACFKSKRRITIRRERVIAKNGQRHEDGGVIDDDRGSRVRIDAIVGADILQVEGLVDRMFEIYRSTVDKFFWGRPYLTLDFFKRVCQTSFVRNLCFLCARYDDAVQTTNRNECLPVLKAEDVFAGTFNVIKSGVFYGRYWGCLPGRDGRKNLHFEMCYWSAIEYCIQNGLERMEPGAGGGDYKWVRGFDPQLVHSVHYIRSPHLQRAVFQFIQSETDYHVSLMTHLLRESAVAERKDLRRLDKIQ